MTTFFVWELYCNRDIEQNYLKVFRVKHNTQFLFRSMDAHQTTTESIGNYYRGWWMVGRSSI